jgi:WXXGXW repeat (2 copies)
MRYRFLLSLIPALALAALPAISSAGLFVGVSVNFAPPPLPVYEQPPCPEVGYLWVPGYWAWNDGAYYWVPGTWVLPPEVGLLWTPGYWGWDDGDYFWHAGYWGPQVGFYGGVRYGFGYDGVGYDGGYWRGREFFYNRAVVRVGPTFVTNVYYHPVEYRGDHEHVSFNGGPGGVRAHASREQIRAEHEHHVAFTPLQERQQRMAFADRSLRADYNHGRPPIAATARATAFHGRDAFAARAAGGPVRDHAAARAAHGPMHDQAPARAAGPLRSDRPAWASGQNRADHPMERPMERRAPMRSQPGSTRPPAERFQERAPRPAERPQARPQPEYRQNLRPQQNFRPQQQNFRPPEAARRAAPREQHGGGPGPGRRPPENHRPPENRGGGRGR